MNRSPFNLSFESLRTRRISTESLADRIEDIRGGGDRLRLPCFVIEENAGLLPAFSAFTGGMAVGPSAEGKRVFAIADAAVIEV